MKKSQDTQVVRKGTSPWLWLILSALVVVLDQCTKWLCVAFLEPVKSITLIPGLLRLTYLENSGMAGGLLSNQRWVFMVFSTVAIVGVTVYLVRFSEQNRLLRWALALIIGGGVGNMIDRLSPREAVIDFIDFYGIWPLVFNVADSAVCIGAAILLCYYVWAMIQEMRQSGQSASEQNGDQSGDASGGQA